MEGDLVQRASSLIHHMHTTDLVSLPDANSDSGDMHGILCTDEWKSLQHMSARPFSMYVGPNVSMCNAKCAQLTCLSPDQFLQLQSLEGHHVFLQPDLANISRTLSWYRKLQSQHPTSVSACIYTPRWYNQKWRDKLSMLQQLKVYCKGTCLLPKQPLKYDGGVVRYYARSNLAPNHVFITIENAVCWFSPRHADPLAN